jgi:hypothetical protein
MHKNLIYSGDSWAACGYPLAKAGKSVLGNNLEETLVGKHGISLRIFQSLNAIRFSKKDQQNEM